MKVSSFLLIQLYCFKKRLEVSNSKSLRKKKRQVSYCRNQNEYLEILHPLAMNVPSERTVDDYVVLSES